PSLLFTQSFLRHPHFFQFFFHFSQFSSRVYSWSGGTHPHRKMGYSPHCALSNRNYPLGVIIVRFDNEKLRASTYSRPMKRFILLLGLAAASWSALELRGAEDSD